MCKNQERIIDQFAGYVCAIAFVCPLLTFLLNGRTNTHTQPLAAVYVGSHMCSGIGLFAYFTLIMFYGKLLLVCGCSYGIAYLLGYYIFENITSTTTINSNDDDDDDSNNKRWK